MRSRNKCLSTGPTSSRLVTQIDKALQSSLLPRLTQPRSCGWETLLEPPILPPPLLNSISRRPFLNKWKFNFGDLGDRIWTSAFSPAHQAQTTLVRQQAIAVNDKRSLELIENTAKGVDSLLQTAIQEVFTGHQYLNVVVRGQDLMAENGSYENWALLLLQWGWFVWFGVNWALLFLFMTKWKNILMDIMSHAFSLLNMLLIITYIQSISTPKLFLLSNVQYSKPKPPANSNSNSSTAISAGTHPHDYQGSRQTCHSWVTMGLELGYRKHWRMDWVVADRCRGEQNAGQYYLYKHHCSFRLSQLHLGCRVRW